jgi:hypothetical protein
LYGSQNFPNHEQLVLFLIAQLTDPNLEQARTRVGAVGGKPVEQVSDCSFPHFAVKKEGTKCRRNKLGPANTLCSVLHQRGPTGTHEILTL